MIGGAELEPESGMYNPHGFDVPTIHAAISERQQLAAHHRNQANDVTFLQSDAARMNEHRKASLAGIKCKAHERQMQVNSGFGAQPPAPADCPNCKRAQTKALKEPMTQHLAQESSPQEVARQHHAYADHYERSAALLKQHLRTRTAQLN